MNDNSTEQKMSRKEREFLARREEILAAATRVFAHKGYHGAAMSEIAKEAEFSTGSLYNFFKNKEELYFTLLQVKIDKLEEDIYEVENLPGGLEVKLQAFLDTVLNFFDTERDFFRIFVEHRQSFETSSKGQFADVISDKYKNYLVRMVNIMAKGIEAGEIRDMGPAELAMIFMGIMNAFMFISANRPDGGSIKDKGRLILDVFFDGTRKR